MPSYWGSNNRKNRIRKYKQQLRQECNQEPTNNPIAQDPRGPIAKHPVHSYLDVDDMPHHLVWRAIEVQKLLEQDATGLHAYEAPYPRLSCPLKFDLIRSAVELKKSELDACLGLVELTSGHDYKASSIGWHPQKKRVEMMDKEMMYLLVRQGNVGGVPESDTEDESQEVVTDPVGQSQYAHIDRDEYGSDETKSHDKNPGTEERTVPKLDAPKPNALEQLVLDYASDSDEEQAVQPEAPVKPKDTAETEAARDSIFEPTASPTSQSVKPLTWPHPSNTGKILGFVSFMFTHDDPPHQGREVVYLYEIHLHERLRGRGLGSNLIKFVEHAAGRCGVSKTMLTVFLANEGARGLYETLGYAKDECSPAPKYTRNKTIEADHMIMSKYLHT